MRTTIGAALSALLGFIVALLSLAARRSRSGRVLVTRALVAERGSRARVVDVSLLSNDGLDDATRDGVAAEWRANGRRAYANSVSSAQRALELAALGAPPKLVQETHEDAADERRVARACLMLARGIDGRDASPPPCDPRRRPRPRARGVSLAVLAADVLLDGVLAEGISARMSAKLARRATDADVRATLEERASAEARHAVHAWSVVAWCIAEGGRVVEHALRAVVRMLPETLVARDVPQVAREGGWERWGIAGGALERQEITNALVAVRGEIAALGGGAAENARRELSRAAG